MGPPVRPVLDDVVVVGDVDEVEIDGAPRLIDGPEFAQKEQQGKMTDAEWADYLFLRKNTKGVHLERWVHTKGCRRWFNMARSTVTHEIKAIYKMGEPAPRIDGEAK